MEKQRGRSSRGVWAGASWIRCAIRKEEEREVAVETYDYRWCFCFGGEGR